MKSFTYLLYSLYVGFTIMNPSNLIARETTHEKIPTPAITITQPDSNLIIDFPWYQNRQILMADLWNGGLDQQSGLGAYRPDFKGFFHAALTREWQQKPLYATNLVAQSRAIYMNILAFKTASSDKARFLKAAECGADFLLTHFYDTNFGGFYWKVTVTGNVVDSQKHGFGNTHALLALSALCEISKNPKYRKAAQEQLTLLETRFMDANYFGAVTSGWSNDFKEPRGSNNIEGITHFFEALLIYYDLEDSEVSKQHVHTLIQAVGNRIVHTLYQDMIGFSDRGYVAFNYDTHWHPSQKPFIPDRQFNDAGYVSIGHGLELAFLLSRAVERGFDPQWLTAAEKLLRFAQLYAFSDNTGGISHSITDYSGQMLPENVKNEVYIWWPQMEAFRTISHFMVIRKWPINDQFSKLSIFIHQYLTDQQFGGLYDSLDPITRTPISTDKASPWKTNYHYAMALDEIIRLGQQTNRTVLKNSPFH